MQAAGLVSPSIHRLMRWGPYKAFLEDARSLLAAAESATDRAMRVSRGEVGELAIGFFAAPMMLLLPYLIRRYRMKYPDVAMRMYELTPDRQLSAVASEEIDIGFTRPLPAGHSNLTVRILFQENFIAVVAETHPLASRQSIKLSELALEPFVLLERSVAISLYDQVIAACLEAGFSPSVVHSPDLMATVLTMVAAEQGVSIAPEGVQNLRSQQVVFVPIVPAMEPIPLVMCWNEKLNSPARDAFVQLVREQEYAILNKFK